MRTREQLLALGKTDPDTEQALKLLPDPLSTLPPSTPAETVLALRKFFFSFPIPPPDPSVAESSLTIHTRDNYPLRLLLFHPTPTTTTTTTTTTRGKPLIVLWHFGGFCIGRPEDMSPFARRFAREFNAVVAVPDYRKAPDVVFPQPVHDGWDALQWIAANAAQLGADPALGFVIGGHSAGANLGGVMAHMARDEGLQPPITGLYFACGSCLPPEMLPAKYAGRYLSRTQPECTESKSLFNSRWKELFSDTYKADWYSPLAGSFSWPTGHKGLPRTYLQICGQDMFRDEEFLYEEVLREEGVPTRVDVYPGQPHCFWGMVPHLEKAAKAREDMVAGMAWLLEVEGPGGKL